MSFQRMLGSQRKRSHHLVCAKVAKKKGFLVGWGERGEERMGPRKEDDFDRNRLVGEFILVAFLK